MFILRAQPHAQSLFLFPIVFGINLIHFDEKTVGAAGNLIVCFSASIPCHAIWQKQNEERKLFRRAEKLRCKFLARKSAKLFANTIKGGHFWQGKVQNSSPSSALLTWRHFHLALSHRAHLTHNIGSASYNKLPSDKSHTKKLKVEAQHSHGGMHLLRLRFLEMVEVTLDCQVHPAPDLDSVKKKCLPMLSYFSKLHSTAGVCFRSCDSGPDIELKHRKQKCLNAEDRPIVGW